MISFAEGNVRFNFKVSGVALHNGRVLLTTDEHIDYWYLPGGRVELLEVTDDTLRREMKEELGLEANIGPLLWVAENFFDRNGVFYQEIVLYYLMTFSTQTGIYDAEGIIEGSEPSARLFFKWFRIDDLEGVRLYPPFFRTALSNIPNVTQRIVIRE